MELWRPEVIETVDCFLKNYARAAFFFIGDTCVKRDVSPDCSTIRFFRWRCHDCKQVDCDLHSGYSLPSSAFHACKPFTLFCNSTLLVRGKDFIILNGSGFTMSYPILIHGRTISREGIFGSVSAMRAMGVEKYQAVILTAERFSR